MDVTENPRPNHRLIRCCGTCKFFLKKSPSIKKGRCILPDGPKMTSNPGRDLKDKIDTFAPTYVCCCCDNHQWRQRGYLKEGIKYAGVKSNVSG